MNSTLKRIIEKLVEIMKQEGIDSIHIYRNTRWNAEKQDREYDDTYNTDIHMSNRH